MPVTSLIATTRPPAAGSSRATHEPMLPNLDRVAQIGTLFSALLEQAFGRRPSLRAL
jgi:hypothetical protein